MLLPWAEARRAASATGDNSLPTVPNSGRSIKTIQREREDEGFGEQARCCLLIGALAAGPLAGAPQASAQNYPSRNITAIIPFAAGNANDITARIVFEQLQKQLGQPIVIESRPRRRRHHRRRPGGARHAGRLHHRCSIRRRSAPSYVTHKTLPYDTLKDFTAVSAVGISPSVLVAAPSKGYKTAADLIAAAKAKPGELNFASAGIGAASHLAAEKFTSRRRHQGAAHPVPRAGRGARPR